MRIFTEQSKMKVFTKILKVDIGCLHIIVINVLTVMCDVIITIDVKCLTLVPSIPNGNHSYLPKKAF